MTILSTMRRPGFDGPGAEPLGSSPGLVWVWWASWGRGLEGPAAVDSWYRLLDEPERRRCGRLGMPEDRRKYIAAHGLLRLALSAGSDMPPEQWRFRPGRNGRPELAAGPWDDDIRFSISHTRGLVACAVGVGVEVGVDVEAVEDGPGIHEAAEAFLAEPERQACKGLAPADRTRRLYEYWTLKEAFAKALGLGLALPPESAAFELDGRGGARVRCGRAGATEDWRLALWAPTGRHVMAAAVRDRGGRNVTLVQWRYEVSA